MRKYSLSSLFDVQLFGDAGAGAAQAAPGAEIGGQGENGQKAAAPAQPQDTGEKAPRSEPGEAPDAGERKDPGERAARFEALIRGEFKDLYEQRIRDTLRRRLKGSEESLRRYSALAPALERLAERYGLDAADAEGISRAVCAEEDEAPHPESPEQRQRRFRRLAQEQLADWARQAESLRQLYPSFDLKTEAGDSRFRSLLRSGLPLRTAFEALHQDEILPAAMAYSARRAEERLADSVIAGSLRPAEGAMEAQSPVLSKRDVSSLSRAEREEIDRRVARGEKIRF